MEYRNLGKCGVKVSPLCLGTGFRSYWHNLTDEKTCSEVIHALIAHGGNFIDCANYYFQGRCEEVVGKTLKGLRGRRDDLVITTKVCARIGPGPNDGGLSRYHIMREIERSLKRLRTDHVDIYLLHGPDGETPVEETLRALDDLVRQGKARYFGACNHTPAEVVESLALSARHHLDSFVCLQNGYNLLNRRIEAELLDCCRRHGLGLMTFSPLAIGLLSGRYRKGTPAPERSIWNTRREDPGKSTWDGTRDDFGALVEQADGVIGALVEVAAELDRTPGQVAVAWVLDHPEVTSAIIGPDLPEHVEDAFGAVGWELPGEARQRLDEASAACRLSSIPD